MDDHLPYEHRYTAASVLRVFPTAIDVALNPPVAGSTEARIQSEHWGERKHWATGDKIGSVFVYNHLSAKQARSSSEQGASGHAFASAKWGDPSKNPWDRSHPRHPERNRIWDAVVVRHANEDTAVVRLGGDLTEGFLHLHQVPMGRFKSIHELLPTGLRTTVKLLEVESGLCHIEASVVAWLEDVARRQGERPGTEGVGTESTPYLRLVDAPGLHSDPVTATLEGHPNGGRLAQRWAGKGVLIIDDDAKFRRAMVRWLQQFGAQAWSADNPQHADDLFTEHGTALTHLLVDYNLGTARDVLDVVRLMLARRKGRPLAIVSGMVDALTLEGVERLRRLKGMAGQELPLLAKPLPFGVMDRWLRQDKAVSVTAADITPGEMWAHDSGPATHDIANRAAHWLAAVCAHEGAIASMWLRCHQPGYELVAQHGLPSGPGSEDTWRSLLNHADQTSVADVERTGKPEARSQHAKGALAGVWPAGATHFLAVPMREESIETWPRSDLSMPVEAVNQVTDVVVLFAKASLTRIDLTAKEWRSLHRWWMDLVELERVQTRLMEDSVFSTQGRVHGATLHEMRPLLQVFRSPKPWSAEDAAAWWPNGRRVSQLVEGGLYNIRPERIAEFSLRERILTLMQDYLWQFAARRFVHLMVHLPPPDLLVTLAPEVVEQPLVNLVDNATKSCMTRRWARVEVQVLLSEDDPERPLVLRVADQGLGMTPAEQRQIFLPRHTQEGQGGFGMGLYVSRRLARAAGGDVVLVENHRWGGCVFELRLPLAWGQKQQRQQTQE